jgi:hypothetical protein
MKLKTSEMRGVALDWAVARAEGAGAALVSTHSRGDALLLGDPTEYCNAGDHFQPSTNWQDGGPIIERERIEFEHDGFQWWARIRADEDFSGPAPLVAAMRCYVASVLGEEVDVPDSIALDSLIYETEGEE